jgi:hypothetical protein
MASTFVIADLQTGIVIILWDNNDRPDNTSFQKYTGTPGWKIKHLISNEDWPSSSMHMQVLSQGVRHNSWVNSDSPPGWL